MFTLYLLFTGCNQNSQATPVSETQAPATETVAVTQAPVIEASQVPDKEPTVYGVYS